MKYAICLQVFIPMRTEANEAAEMSSQLLFGDTFRILKELPRWYYVVRDYDGDEGWIDWKTATLLDEARYNSYLKASATAPLVRQPYVPVTVTENGLSGQTHLSWGSRIFGLDDIGVYFKMEHLRYDIPSTSYIQPVDVTTMSRKACSKYLLQQAQMLLNIPYLWGGVSAFGLDCSGFTQTLFRFIGITLPRNSFRQFEVGEEVAFDERLECDLAFFGNDGKVSHVGLVADKNRILHASGLLHFDELRKEGIYSERRGELTHKLIGIKRLF